MFSTGCLVLAQNLKRSCNILGKMHASNNNTSLLFSEHTLKLVKVKLQVFSCTPICKSKSQTSSCLSLIKDVLYT